LRSRRDRLPQADTIALLDAAGIRVNYSGGWPTPPGDMAGRDCTVHFAAADDPGLFISDPAISRTTNVRSIFLVRRVDGPHAEYLGMVLASVPLSVFREVYRSINLPASESLMLLRRDGTVLMRYPD